MIDLSQIVGFDWDDGNARKSLDKHGVTAREAESVFSNEPLMVVLDEAHSQAERRFQALGRTDDQRRLHVTFTLRKGDTLIRIVSSRDMSRKERKLYEEA